MDDWGAAMPPIFRVSQTLTILDLLKIADVTCEKLHQSRNIHCYHETAERVDLIVVPPSLNHASWFGRQKRLR